MRRHDSDDTFVMAAPVRVDTMFVPVMSRRYVPRRLTLARGSETTHTDPSDPAALVTVAPVIATDRVPRNSRRFLTANPVTGWLNTTVNEVIGVDTDRSGLAGNVGLDAVIGPATVTV